MTAGEPATRRKQSKDAAEDTEMKHSFQKREEEEEEEAHAAATRTSGLPKRRTVGAETAKKTLFFSLERTCEDEAGTDGAKSGLKTFLCLRVSFSHRDGNINTFISEHFPSLVLNKLLFRR